MSTTDLEAQRATFRMGEDKEIRATVLQQLLLFDDPLIVQNEERDTAEKNAADGLIDLSLRNLHEERIVTFAQGKIEVPDWGGDWTKCRADIEEQLSTFRSWMIDQLMSSVPAIASFGFDILTGRATSKANWVGLCGREREIALTQSEMAAADLRLQQAREGREAGKCG
jgi:hypothetical protein